MQNCKLYLKTDILRHKIWHHHLHKNITVKKVIHQVQCWYIDIIIVQIWHWFLLSQAVKEQKCKQWKIFFKELIHVFYLTSYLYNWIISEVFQRAVRVCTGHTLAPHVVNTVFQIFDSDGDGSLSYQEFISIMKDRLHRGARVNIFTFFFKVLYFEFLFVFFFFFFFFCSAFYRMLG